jgi:hypothetical protein
MSNVGPKAVPLQVPFPSAGLNYLNPPTDLEANEAADLINFYPMQEGLRQALPPTVVKSPSSSAGTVLSYFDLNGAPHYVWCIDHAIWIDNVKVIYHGQAADGSTVTITNDNWWLSTTGTYLQFTNGVDYPIRYNLATATIYQPSTNWTVPAGYTYISQGCNYKNRWYCKLDNGTIGYGGTAPIATMGVLTAWTVRGAFKESASILFFTPWTYNQGLTNEELFVVVCTSGEVLVYSGDWPAAPNWQLVGRTKIPLPVADASGSAYSNSINFRAFCLIGQDIYISTIRGVISLQRVFQGQNQDAALYQMSRKLGTKIVLGNCQIVTSQSSPLLFVAGSYDDATVINYIYAMNTETGAWTKLDGIVTLNSGSAPPRTGSIQSMAYANGYLYVSFAYVGGAFDIFSMSDGIGVSSTTVTSTWQTPYINFGSNLQKRTKLSRLILSLPVAGLSVTASQSVAGDFNDNFGLADARVLPSIARPTNYDVELMPPGVSEQLSYKTIITATGTGTVEYIYAMYIWAETGGVY